MLLLTNIGLLLPHKRRNHPKGNRRRSRQDPQAQGRRGHRAAEAGLPRGAGLDAPAHPLPGRRAPPLRGQLALQPRPLEEGAGVRAAGARVPGEPRGRPGAGCAVIHTRRGAGSGDVGRGRWGSADIDGGPGSVEATVLHMQRSLIIVTAFVRLKRIEQTGILVGCGQPV